MSDRPETGPSMEARRLSELGLHAAGLVHELRQPLFAIKALAQLAQAQPGREGDTLAGILEQVATMEALVGGYHDFSKSPSLSPQVFDIWDPVRSALVVLAHRATAAQVRLVLGDQPAVAARGSLLAVQQALVNLGQNAIDAVRGLPDAWVRIECEATDEAVRVVVVDNGPGLADEIRAHLFEPFRTTKAGGTGLGLSLSRELVLQSGGELLLREGAPTTWEIVLPRVA